MDYYSYQNSTSQNVGGEVSTNPQASTTNGNNTYALQSPSTSYRNADPRLNYSYYAPNNFLPTNPTSYDSTSYFYELSLSNPPDISIKSDDELWIETWLSKIGKIQINLNSTVQLTPETPQKPTKPPVKNAMQISTAKNSLKDCLQVLDKLQEMQNFLKTNAASMSTAEWRKHTMEIGAIKDDFSKLFTPFENSEIVANLRKNVEVRRKKRTSQKRRRKQAAENRLYVKEMNRKAHKDIDQWLENMKEQVERVKMEENMKKDADCVLAEVTKKKSDARKSLSLITSLVKLRHVREQAAIQRGEKVSSEDRNAFATVSDHLTKIWKDALLVYSKEEHGLRVMLEHNANEDTNAARAAKEARITQDWECALFGPKCIPTPIYWGLTAADKDLETFIAIRKSWDTFLAKTNDENGSAIPVGWVTPSSYPGQSWIKYLHTL